MVTLEYWFDFSCPYAYLGSTQVETVARQANATLIWRPMLLGGIFRERATPQNMNQGMAESKARHNLADMKRWAELFAVPLEVPKGHPFRTVRALRTLLAAPEPAWPNLIRGFYRAYWQQQKDVADPSVILEVVQAAGLSPAQQARCLAGDQDPAVKDDLFTRTQSAVERGIFGAPTMFISDGDKQTMLWGQDRLFLAHDLARGWSREAASLPPTLSAALDAARSSQESVELWFDISSPFSHFALEAAARLSAKISIAYKPMLLGALFRQNGTADVPLLAMNQAKQDYVRHELQLWSAVWQAPFEFTSHFPLRTVTAQRLMVAYPQHAELRLALSRAAWRDNRNVSSAEILSEILRENGLEPSVALAKANAQEGKDALRQNTDQALASGIFGAPTWKVGQELFWGQDRMLLALRHAGCFADAKHPTGNWLT